ncbi:MAG: hypothetical protein A2052_08880 [Deltaproteobacteria bacterium GWA2_54_12]|nr:MAG: hypothetical protein A2052_08880 [Deltaproteobacteria bacterium GWA2_54_12]
MNENCVKEAGFISVRALFWLLFLAVSFYGAYMFVPPYVGFYMLKTEVEEEARVAHMYTDEALESRITGKAAAWSIPLGPENLEIIRGRYQIRITVDYTVTLNFLDRYDRELVYNIDVSEPLKASGRVLQ